MAGSCCGWCVASAGNTLSVRELMVAACSVWRQAYTLKVLSVSVLSAEGSLAVGCWGCLVGEC